ncbi:hypothetical protein B4065_2952 [Caldibacillus thermoamylovorans]|nr:hypothetical protein B4065_2952 [Caldibacillus thermoamylovorans]
MTIINKKNRGDSNNSVLFIMENDNFLILIYLQYLFLYFKFP